MCSDRGGFREGSGGGGGGGGGDRAALLFTEDRDPTSPSGVPYSIYERRSKRLFEMLWINIVGLAAYSVRKCHKATLYIKPVAHVATFLRDSMQFFLNCTF